MNKLEQSVNRFFETHARAKPAASALICFLIFIAETLVFDRVAAAIGGITGEIVELLLIPAAIMTLFAAMWRLADVCTNKKMAGKIHRGIILLAAAMAMGYVFIAVGTVAVKCG